MQLASIYFKDKKYEFAEELLKECLPHNMMNLQINRLLGEVEFKLKKYKASVVQYEHLLQLGDSTDANFQKLGFSHYFLSQSKFTADTLVDNHLEIAIKNLSISKRIDELDPLTSLYLGICYKELRNYDAAIFHLNDCIDLLFPGYTSDVFTHLAASYELNKDFSKAISSYQNAYNYNPANKTLLFYLASAMDQFYEDRETPLSYYKTFLKSYQGEDQNLIQFSEQRVEKLIEENHFYVKAKKGKVK